MRCLDQRCSGTSGDEPDASGRRLVKGLGSKLMVTAGEASYAFYLIHTQVMFGLGAGSSPHGATSSGVAAQLLAFAIDVAVSVGLHHMFERPASVFVADVLGVSDRTS